jgi:phosphogluconate dehydratase
MIDERCIVNAIVGLHATGGSANHTLHIVAMAQAAGVLVNWDDFSDLSEVVPLLARIYPNGGADVNHFHAAGGTGFLVRELLDAGLLHEDVTTVSGKGLRAYTQEPYFDARGALAWRNAPGASADTAVLRPASDPFSPDGGLRVVRGNLGRAVVKVSSVKSHCRLIEAPAAVFDDQEEVMRAFKAGALTRDVVVIVRHQGPRANGMPELHKLTPALASLQDKGFKVALVTDGRMSGASGAVPAAIHVTPEVASGGPLGKVRDGDIIRLDCGSGVLEAKVPAEIWNARELPQADLRTNEHGMGRELFKLFRANAAGAEQGGGLRLDTP